MPSSRRATPAHVQALVRRLRGEGKSVRAIVAAAAELGCPVSRAAVGRLCQDSPPPGRPRPVPAVKLAKAAVRLTSGPGGGENIAAALVLLDAARAELARFVG